MTIDVPRTESDPTARVSTESIPWRRSTRCEAGDCVEVLKGDVVAQIRNSQRPDDVLSFDRQGWSTFVDALKAGELG